VSRLNVASLGATALTHEGAKAWPHTTAEQRLRRSVLSCLLWEREFYEDGASIAERIAEAAEAVRIDALAALAIEARTQFKLRHVPLLLLATLARRARGEHLVSETIAQVVQRADELTEFLAVYAKANGVAPNALKPKLSGQVKKGLAAAFARFDEYQLAKYDRAGAVRLRDVLFLTHAKPADDAQAALWKRLIANELAIPDTWEVALSGGADKKETFERLIREGRLGYLALLRNLRNMAEAGCDRDLVRSAILARKGADRVLPFRYIASARACPQYEPDLDVALLASIESSPSLDGQTVVLVDVSGSMDYALSAKSDLKRIDAGAALGAIVRGNLRLFTFSEALVEVAPRRGMAGVDAIVKSQPHRGTDLGGAIAAINANVPHDRLIVITDEQSRTRVPDPVAKRAYMINVASAQNGVGYGKWTHIDGFSEQVVRFIIEAEATPVVSVAD
jgi:hypothetical protein